MDLRGHGSPFHKVFLHFLLLTKFLLSSGTLSIPNFIKSPDDQTGIYGGVASFICQATGDPKPLITWMKKGKKVNSPRFERTRYLLVSPT
ncbi:protein tyrosine phosphatase receptor type Fa isoform X2 [Poecilia formosa]|uniref:protein tyrosine phosphatase receptor type Fa isoform X2 n=1 Tax=Poecilia formosa TaxID=48698 RepID=UPI0007BADB8B|nr:PREDICTED: receptor-type tyrosine-protein phosphatase F-like isoform X2 [Poecilia formosa]